MKFKGLCYSIILSFCLFLPAQMSLAAEGIQLHTTISGIDGEALKNVTARLKVLEESFGGKLNTDDIQTYYQNAKPNIRKALEPFGYFQTNIETHLSHQGQNWEASFQIQLGEPVIIQAIHYAVQGAGQNDPVLSTVLNKSKLKEGQIFSSLEYDQAKQGILDSANAQGYLKATLIKKEVYIDLAKRSAVINLIVDTGPQYYFGNIRFHDQDAFSDAFLSRFLNFKTGEVYSSAKVLGFQQNLNNSHFFRNINVDSDLHAEKNYQVPIEVSLKPEPSQQYNFGLGYGTFTGARVTTGVNLRHLTKTGHHMNIQAKYSSILSGLAVQYVIPGKNPLTDEYTIGVNAQKFIPKNGYSNSKTLSLGYVKSVQHWKHTINLNYLRETSFISGPNNVSHNARIFYPSYTISHTVTNDILNPTEGHRVELSIKGASDQLISNTRFVQTELKAKWMFSPLEGHRIILRGDFGYTVVKDLTTLPISLQFYAGGLDSVRVFPYSYEGPGRYLKVASVEYQHRIVDKWHGALFYDMGTASNDFTTPMDRSAGIGIIYQSIIGPVKIYAGRTLTGATRHYGLDFSIGPEL